MALKRNDVEVSNFRLVDEGKHQARITDYTVSPSKFDPKRETITLEWKITGGEFAGEKVKQFCDFDLNELNQRSLIWVIAGLTGEMPEEYDEDDLVGQKGTIVIKHNKRKVTKDGVEQERTYANVIDVEKASRKGPGSKNEKAKDTAEFYEDDATEDE